MSQPNYRRKRPLFNIPADGSVHAFSLMINPIMLKAFSTRAGGEVIDISAFDPSPVGPSPSPTPTPLPTPRR